jgi:hypothetical protein
LTTRPIVNQTIKWDNVPKFIPIKLKGAFEEPHTFALKTAPPRETILSPGDYFNHKTKVVAKVRDQYRDAGFATRVILQDPRSHRGPTVACTIGFPTNLPANLWTNELRIFKRFVCRLHADIASAPDGDICSIPHVEPDPIFHWKEHVEYSTLKHLEVKGRSAVRILSHFLYM